MHIQKQVLPFGVTQKINTNMERLQKIIAQAGIASRRKAEELIQEGRVKVNGETIEESFTIDLGTSNTTSSVATSGSGGNKNADGTVTFTNLLYTVTYKEPSVGIFNLKSGQSTITNVRVGETKIIRVYIGDTIIFENI